MTDDEITPAALGPRLHTQLVGRTILHFPSLSSTNDTARQAAKEGAVEGTVVLADEQTAARGRLGRSWLSPRGAIAVSVVLRPELEHLARLGMIASLAVARAIERATGLRADIKWPNDVLIRGRKVCGVLMESSVPRCIGVVEWAVVGIGLNVNLDPGQFPEIAGTATSLSAELGRTVSRRDVLVALLEELDAYYAALSQGQPVHLEWQERLVTLGQGVRASWGGRVEDGVAEGVDSEGCLLLRREDGTLAVIPAGDVTLRDGG